LREENKNHSSILNEVEKDLLGTEKKSLASSSLANRRSSAFKNIPPSITNNLFNQRRSSAITKTPNFQELINKKKLSTIFKKNC